MFFQTRLTSISFITNALGSPGKLLIVGKIYFRYPTHLGALV